MELLLLYSFSLLCDFDHWDVIDAGIVDDSGRARCCEHKQNQPDNSFHLLHPTLMLPGTEPSGLR